ncbi:protein prenylyltransferase superfamily protein [Actinidia rufa]|uniref:ER membrane protein complex subunit 2 n=1 Tax=Actinidia rufa TaxID=165716 RepID=A0A7J0F0M7_9ERIC|nr:protein prenylyltransferase superfamily protein [Actinidia rufa]
MLRVLKISVPGYNPLNILSDSVCLAVAKAWPPNYEVVLYTVGGLENLQAAKKYYASVIDLTGGKNTRALFGICLCTFAIGQLTKGRNKEEKESLELQSLAATALEKDYKQIAPSKLSLLRSTLKSLKLS